MNHLFYDQTSTVEAHIGHEKVFWMALAAFTLLSTCHLLIGSNPVVVAIAFMIMIMGIVPVTIGRSQGIGALFVLLVAFRYVDFAALAKFLMLQPLDSNLELPLEAFFAVLLGLTGYLIAFFMSTLIFVGRPLLKPIVRERKLLIVSILGALIGGAAWFGKISAVNRMAAGVDLAHATTVYAFFTSFYLLAIIAATAQTLIASNRQRSISAWCAILLFTQLIFGVIANSRMPILNGILAYIMTIMMFKGRMKWRYVALGSVVAFCVIWFITPIMLYVRGSITNLSASGRLRSTVGTAVIAMRNAQVLNDLRERIIQSQSFLDYYGQPRNVLQRASLVEHVDVIIDGISRSKYEGFESIKIGLGRLLPRFINPEKDVGWSLGDKLYNKIGIRTTIGGYSTVPLIADGYASFGWIGAFFFPIVFATPILVILRKIGWLLPQNIWAIYFLLRFHNSFVEQASGGYLLIIVRYLPQDLLLLLAIDYIARVLTKYGLRRKTQVPF